jgi:hypothetical protein
MNSRTLREQLARLERLGGTAPVELTPQQEAHCREIQELMAATPGLQFHEAFKVVFDRHF